MKYNNFGKILTILALFLMVGAGCEQTRISVTPATTTPQVNDPGLESAKEVTLQGTWVCLPHQVTGGMETMECAFGFKTDDGKHYAADLSAYQAMAGSGPDANDRVEIKGLLTPIEQISNNVWSNYDVRGVIKVTSLEKK